MGIDINNVKKEWRRRKDLYMGVFLLKKGKEKNGSEKREDKSSSLVFTSRSFLSHSSYEGKQKNDR